MRKVFAALVAAVGLLNAAVIPRPAGEYTVNLPGGQKWQLSNHKGKVVVMEFLLTTCPTCQKTSATMSKVLREYGPKGVEAVGIAINPMADTNDFKSRFGVTFPVGTASRESVYGFLQHSFMNPNLLMPQLVFIDKTGTVRAQYAGNDNFIHNNEEANLREMLDKLLSEGAPKKTAAPAKKKKAS